MSALDFLPYYPVEKSIRRRQGTWNLLQMSPDTRLRGGLASWLPYGFVRPRALKRAAEIRRGLVAAPTGTPSGRFEDPDGRIVAGIAAARNDAGAVRRDARILVCLHLFYPDLWPVVRTYLDNLSPYGWDLVVTYPGGLVPEATLDEVRAYRPDARFVGCRNAGFDVGPFVEALNSVDLDRYDIVFKLQTKGCGRPLIYIYDQVFKRADWFLNLYEGVLGGGVVHGVVGSLMSGEASLCAAENLIVRDPKHKRFFMRRFCEERHLAYDEGYRFVAGTCFAIRAEALKPLKALGLALGDFVDTVRGEFSLAHAIERWMCFAAGGRMKGIPVGHPVYPEEAAWFASRSAIRLLDDSRFELDYDFFHRSLEMLPIRDYEVAEVRLGDIRRIWTDQRAYSLDRLPPYRYIEGDVAGYENYCRENAETGFLMSRGRFDALRESMADYDERRMPVVIGEGNFLMDGQHRSCILMKRFGSDHRIKVLRVFS